MNYGDYLLKETANCIQRAMEPGQKLFRLVSDQFIITDLTGRSMSDASLLYNRIRYEIARETRRSRKQRRVELKAARRQLHAQRRAAREDAA